MKNQEIFYYHTLREWRTTLNTYSSLTKENPYLAPTSNLIPSFSKYNLNIGIRSRLASVLNFDMGFIFDEIENFNFLRDYLLIMKIT